MTLQKPQLMQMYDVQKKRKCRSIKPKIKFFWKDRLDSILLSRLIKGCKKKIKWSMRLLRKITYGEFSELVQEKKSTYS